MHKKGLECETMYPNVAGGENCPLHHKRKLSYSPPSSLNVPKKGKKSPTIVETVEASDPANGYWPFNQLLGLGLSAENAKLFASKMSPLSRSSDPSLADSPQLYY